MKKTFRIFLSLLSCFLLSRSSAGLEGKWMPEQILQLDPEELRSLGLEIPPTTLWSAEGAGLFGAAAKIGGGCTGGFISPDGLLITNQHCVFFVLQQHSTPDKDLMASGFLAATRGEELIGRGLRATIPIKTIDVTAEIESAAATAGEDGRERLRKIQRRKSELVADCEKQSGHRCQVETQDGGVRYHLFDQIEYGDVRLVFAPPNAVADYGGEVDNWKWPRHAADIAILRVYADAQGAPAGPREGTAPYHPRHHFRVTTAGCGDDCFIMLLGYPTLTFRALTAAELRERTELFYPRMADLYQEWISLMETASRGSEEARVALAGRMRALTNDATNARGQIAAFQRGRLLDKKRTEEQAVLAWARSRPEHAGAVAAHAELSRLLEEQTATWDRDFLFHFLARLRSTSRPLDFALLLARWSEERARPDMERDPDFSDRQRERILDRLRNSASTHLPTDEAILGDLLLRFSRIPEGNRSPAVDRLLAGDRSPEAIRAKATELFARSRVTDRDERLKMFEQTADELRARHDPLLDLAFELDQELRAWDERYLTFLGTASRLRPQWRRAVMAHAGKPLAPDANGTLRVSLAHIRGYTPRDAVSLQPRTRLFGLLEKDTGQPPFAAPAAVLSAIPTAPESRWADPRLRDVPVNFLADADTSGGNSGSPVLNGRGELIGVNFDRVWENVANDFGYNPDIARNVSVDIRYVLWLIETLHRELSKPLLVEMGVLPQR